MKLTESYKKRLQELAGTKVLVESSIVKDELNNLPFKKDIDAIGGKLYSVGGRVRDELLGKQSKDLDILITGVPLDRLEHILIKYGKVKEVGKSFGIIKFIPFGKTEDIDIAIPRTEKKKENGTGYKGFDVNSDHNLPVETDLERRDFTMNSVAKDADGNTIDPFGGLDDIKNKIIRATSKQSFGDDPVRMIRAIQFAARFGFTIEPETMAMIKKNASKIKEEPSERFITEFDKIIKKGNIQYGMELLIESGLFKEITGFNYAGDKDFSKVKTMSDLLYKMVEGSGNVASEFVRKNLLNETNVLNQIKCLELQNQLTGNKVNDRKVVQKILNLSPNIEESGLLKVDTKAIIKTFLNGEYPLKTNGINFSGDDLKALGFQKEKIGDKQRVIMDAILSDEIPNKKEDILKFLEFLHKKENPTDDKTPQSDTPGSIYLVNEIQKAVKEVLTGKK